MLTIGIIVLAFFIPFGIFIIVKGIRQGDEVNSYNTSGKMYLWIGVFTILFALGLSVFCFVKHAELSSYNYEYDDYEYDDNDYDDDYGYSSNSSFTNKYGTRTTKCVVSGCSNYIATSGDTNCCVSHSNKCGECYCYIDGDAMFCMSCISSAIGGNSNSSSNNSSHECYVCGDKAYSKYGSYYYCSDCLALVKAFSD